MTHREPPSMISPLDERSIEKIVEALERRRAQPAKNPFLLHGDLLWRLAHFVVAALIAYGVANTRIAVLESRVDGLKSDLQEIRQDVKQLLSRP